MFNLSVSFTLSLYISLLHCSSTSSLHLLFDLPRLSVTSFIPNTACLAICLLAFYIMSCVSLSAQHGATLCCSLAKSREHRRLSTAIALCINVRTHRSAQCTLNNRRPCVLCDRSSGVEHLDTVRAVLWVTHNFSTSPEDWTVLTLLPRLTISVFVQ